MTVSAAMTTLRPMHPTLNTLLDQFRAASEGGQRPIAVAFSGGVDSTLALWAARQALGELAVGVSVRSEFLCASERARAEAMAAHLGLSMGADRRCGVVVRRLNALEDASLRANGPDRCYLCKRHVLAAVDKAARERFGRPAVIADGTNADDDPARPGRRALAEAGAISPLAACGIPKAGVRELARLMGLPNAGDPSNSCLATRVPTGHELTHKRLTAIEALERAARDMGLADLRARLVPGESGQPGRPDAVRLEVRPAQLLLALSLKNALAERAAFIGLAQLTIGERS